MVFFMTVPFFSRDFRRAGATFAQEWLGRKYSGRKMLIFGQPVDFSVV
jgi:hypothetical protein